MIRMCVADFLIEYDTMRSAFDATVHPELLGVCFCFWMATVFPSSGIMIAGQPSGAAAQHLAETIGRHSQSHCFILLGAITYLLRCVHPESPCLTASSSSRPLLSWLVVFSSVCGIFAGFSLLAEVIDALRARLWRLMYVGLRPRFEIEQLCAL